MKFIKKGIVLLPGIFTEIIESMYGGAERFLSDTDGIIILFKNVLRVLPKAYARRKEIVREMLFLGYNSVLLVVLSVAFLSVVVVLESYYHISLVINDVSMLPGFVSRLIIREVGSTVTALIVICRICPGITSEIALKKETEQLDAYKMMGVDVIEYLVLPAVVASFFTLIILAVLSTITLLLGAMLTCYTHLSLSVRAFWHSTELVVVSRDFISSFVKVLVYGIVVPIVASYCGLSSGSGATEIGKANTRSIVIAGVMVIALDLILTWIFRFLFW